MRWNFEHCLYFLTVAACSIVVLAIQASAQSTGNNGARPSGSSGGHSVLTRNSGPSSIKGVQSPPSPVKGAPAPSPVKSGQPPLPGKGGQAPPLPVKGGQAPPLPVKSGQSSSPSKGYRLSEQGSEKIRKYESYRSKVYQDSKGHQTIGWGHKLTADEKVRQAVKIGEKWVPLAKFTNDVGENLYQQDKNEAVSYLNKLDPTNSLTPKQADALVSLFFNSGPAVLLGEHPKAPKTKALSMDIIKDPFKIKDPEFKEKFVKEYLEFGSKSGAGVVTRREEEAADILETTRDDILKIKKETDGGKKPKPKPKPKTKPTKNQNQNQNQNQKPNQPNRRL